jgi:hemoglobin
LRTGRATTWEDAVIDGEGIPTLIQWAGCPVALTRLISAFYDRVEADELLSPYFPGGVSQINRDHVTAWWIEVL